MAGTFGRGVHVILVRARPIVAIGLIIAIAAVCDAPGVTGPAAVASIVVTPNTTISANSTQQMVAVGFDAEGQVVSIRPTWSVVAGGGTIGPTGIFVAGGVTGVFTNTVIASVGTISGHASITVTVGALAAITIAPSPVTLAVTDSQQFVAVGSDASGNVVQFAPTWSVVAGGGTITASGIFIAGATPGTFANTVVATSGTLSAAVTVVVTAGSLAAIKVTPNPSNLVAGGTQAFSAVGKDATGNVVAIVPVWSVVNAAAGSVNSGTGAFVAGTVPGAYTNAVQAASGAVSGFATVNVVAGVGTMVVNAGNNQSTTAGAMVATAPSVLIRDVNNNPLSGVSVTFAVATGGGSATGLSATTNASGVATVGSWTLGLTAGANTLTATSATLGSPLTFTATGVVGAGTMTVNAGNNQSASAGSAVAIAPSVLVKDVNNNPLSGVSVTFAVATGGGSATGLNATTNASGIATVGSWTLGPTVGANTLTATSTGIIGSPLTVTATATAGTATQIAVGAGNNQSATAGSAVTIAPSVLIQDANHNPVSGVSVTFAVATGGGSITGAAATTNSSGVATIGSWTLGLTAGANTLTVTAAGLTGSPLIFTATGLVGAGAMTVNAGNNQSASAGSAVAIAPSVLIKDVNNNPVIGATVTFAVATGGGSATGLSATTNASGVATIGSWTLGATVGANTLAATSAGVTGSPLTFSATGTVGAGTMTVNAGNNQSATAGSAVTIAPSVLIKDANNNPVIGATVTFAVATGGGSGTGLSATTNASGIATVGSWTLGAVVGANTLNATSAGVTGSPLTFTATAVVGAGAMTVNAGNNQSATAGSAVTIAPSVLIKDVHNNPVSGVSVTFAVASGGGSATSLSATTNASGVATIGSWTLGATVGANTLTATSVGLTGSPLTFTATGVVGAGTMTVNAGNNQSATAGAMVATAPSVVIKDANNNPIIGATVTFAVATGGGSATNLSATTNASGIATVGSWALGATVGANTLSATSAGVTGSPLTFTATGVVGAGTMTVNAGNNQSATAGSAVTIAPSVLIKDANNNPVIGATVTFAVASGGGSGTGLSATTNASGIATVGSWTLGATVGANTLTATSAGVTGSPVTFTATAIVGAATQIAINAGNSQSATDGATVAIAPSVLIKDVHNNPVSGVSVTFAVASGGGSATGLSATTNASGIATIGTWTLGPAVGANTLTATSVGLTGSPLTFTATGVVGAGTMTVNAGNNQSATAGAAVTIAPSVLIKDANNNPVIGAAVTFAVATGGGSATGLSATTNAIGIATVGTWTLGTTVGANTLTAASAGVTGSPLTFTATGLVGAGTMTVNAGNNQSATAGSAVTIAPSVLIKDANNNPVIGATVTFAVASGGGSGTGLSATTNASGIATIGSWTLGTTVGANTLTATSTGVTGSPLTFSATAIVGTATQIAINAGNNQSATDGAAVATAPSVIVKDVHNNPVSGVSVTFAVASGGGSATGLSATTNASGIATVGSWTLGPAVGANTLTATSVGLAGSPLTFTATGVVGAGTMTVNAGNNQTAIAGSAVTIAPSVLIKDANNNPVIGATVTFAVATGGGSATSLSATTNASGIATIGSWTLGATVGANTLTATSAGITGSPLTFTAAGAVGAGVMTVNAGNNQTATAGSAVTITPSVLIKDANNNPVIGATVTFAVATGGGSVAGNAATTNSSGVATATSWTLGPVVGSNTLAATSAGVTGSPLTFTATGVVGAGAMTVNAGNNQSATAGAMVATAPSVIVKDANNNPVTGATVTFAIASGGGSGTGLSATTNSSGIATVGSWTLGVIVGANTLTATSAGVTGSPLTFTATGVVGAGTMTVNGGNNQSVTAGSAVTIAPSVLIKDVNNNPVIGAIVTFAVATGGGSGTGLSATTNSSGIATVGSWTLGATVGANTLTATSAGVTGSPLTFTATAIVGAATQIAINTGNNQSATAGSAVTIAPSVLVKDVHNNAVSGVSVTFAMASGGGSITVGAATTNSSGVATIGSWILGTAAGANTLTATASGLIGSPLTFSATGTVGAGTMTVNAGNNQSATAGSAVATAPSVVIKDVNNNAVIGATVTFAVATGGGSATSLSATTNASGIATVGSWTLGATVGANTLSATSAGITGSPLTFTATGVVGAGTMTVNAGNNQTATAGSAVTIAPSILIKDGNNNPVIGATVTFAISSGGGSATSLSATTNASGIATVGSWTLGATVGANTLTATSAGVTGSPLTFTATGLVGAGTMTVNAGNNQAATAGAMVATAPSVIIKDANNNPVIGATVTFAVATGGGSAISLSATTNASGIATVGSWTLGTTVGANTLTATSAGVTGSPLTFTATGVVGAGTMTINAGNNQSVTAGSAVTVAPSVLIKDANNNPLIGATVTFAVATGGGSVTGLSATTNASGIATVGSWTLGSTVGANTLTATSAGVTGSPITFAATAIAGAATQIAINTGNNQSATDGATIAIAPSVIVKDVNNNPVSGVSVTFAVASGGGSGTGLGATTNSSGIATIGSWTLGATVGANTLTATSAGLTGSPLTFTATGVVGAGSMTVNAGNNQSATAGAAVATSPSVLIKDANNNPIVGATVTFAVATGGGSATGLSATTNAGGIATVGTWTLGTTVGANTLTATSAGVTGSPLTFTATGVVGAGTMTVNAGNNQSATAGSAVTIAPSLLIKDVNNNPVIGATVTFAVATGGGSGTGLSATTNASGIATIGSWTLGATVGANTLTATSTGVTGSPLTFSATAIVGAATQIAINAGNNQSATDGAAVATAPSVLAKDANNNPVSGVNVTFAVASGGGSATGLSATTNASGIATIGGWTLGSTVGANTLTATSVGLTGSPLTFTATGVVGAGTMTVNAGNNQSATAGSAVATAPSVTIKDANNNPIIGATVTFAAATGGGSATGLSATTNSSGVATATSWTLGATVGANTLTATSAGITGSPLTFTATGVVGAGTMTVNAGNNQSATSGAMVATAPSVIVKDANNNPVIGATVTFAVATGGGSATSLSATTNASGIATVGSWTLGASVGANTLTATSAGVTGSPLTFTATAIVGAATQIAINAGNNQSATDGAAVATAPSVIVKDVNNNPVSGVSVTFAVASGGGSATGLSATTNASGIATVGSWTLGPAVGANTLTATSVGLTGSPLTFTATGVVGAGAMTVSAGNNQSAIAGATVATAPSVVIKDANNNPIIGATVTFAIASGGGSATVLSTTTNASGVATVGSWTLGAVVGANTLTATSAGVTGSPLTFSATGTVGAGTMTVNVGNNQSATAGSAVSVAPSVLIKDANNNPVIGATVTFAIASGGGSGTGLSATTNASGIAAIGSWTLGATVGANTLTATSAGVTGSPLTFSATGIVGAGTMTVSAGNNQSATAGSAVAVAPSVLIKDANNNPVIGATVTFAVATGGGSATSLSATTNASGIATIGSWTLGTTVGANTLTATSAGVTGSPLTFTATGVVGPGTMTINAGNNQSATAGSAVTIAPSVLIKDANNNPVIGATVTFAVASGGGSGTGLSAATNSSGIATIGSWTLGATVGANTLTAASAGVTGSPITFAATAIVGAASQIAINAGNSQSATDGATVAIAPSVIVKDVNNNPVSGVSVTFAVATGGGSGTGLGATTNASGVATIGSWTLGSTVGANTLTATSAGLTGSPLTFTATGVVGAGTMTVNAGNNQSAIAGATVATAPSVIIKDANNNPIIGATVTFEVASGGGSGTGLSATTNSSGIATIGSWTLGTTVGANTLTATSAGVTGSPLTFTATGVVGAGTMTVNAGNNQSATAGSAVTVAPSVIIKDANNNPVIGATVTFAVATGGGSGTGLSATTNSSGIATIGSWTLGTTVGANTLTATSAGVTGSPLTFTATAIAGAATQIAINAGNNQSATDGATVAIAPSVIVKDVNNNPVSGVSVTFAVASGGGSGTGLSATTNASGIATVGSWTLGPVVGANTLTATSAGLTGSPLTFTATGVVGAGTMTINTGNGQTAVAGSAVTIAPSVIIQDANHNPVGGVSVTFAIASGGGSATGLSATTNASGIATVGSWTLGAVVGANTLTATSAGITGSPLTFTAAATAGAATQIAFNAGNNQSAPTGTAVATAPSVLVEDANNNPVSGVSVTFAIASGGGSASGLTATTNASGIATIGSWTLGTTPGANALTATAAAPALTGSPLTFSATATVNLGTAAAFAVLGGAGASSCIGTSNVAGDVGVDPAGTISGFTTPCTISAPGDGLVHLNDAAALQAQTDVTTANASLAGMACTTDLTGQDLGLVGTLAPGVYCFTSSAQLTGTLTLSGPANGLWVFRIVSTLTTAAGSAINLAGGAQAANVFWQVGSSAPLGATNSFQGNIIASASITLGAGTTLTGRALAKAAIIMNTNAVVLP